MLRQRVITALLLVAVFLPALFHPEPHALAALSLLMIALGGWEWGRLMGCTSGVSWAWGLACLLACLLTWHGGGLDADWSALWWAMATLWVLGGAWMLRSGLRRWLALPQMLRCALGLAVLWSTWLALVQAKVLGTNFMLSVLLLVWVADITAYFSGRTFGRRKLAPSISPGKSWEGVVGAVVGVMVLAQVWLQIDAHYLDFSPSIYSRLFEQGWPVLAFGVLFLTALSVVGDLVESLLKRCAGVKDSSQLLPGHGGVLDRVDALLPTFPVALWLISWVSS
ncbi:MAG: phosphatidate cytidylyltransferase [Alphaproteobacteria bacterium]|nr:phosphatidate cytidylyltransferase [Alphaproteobacteria bacterium]